MYTALISAESLSANLRRKNWVIIDTRSDLGAVAMGRTWYEQAHIEGAIYAHLDHDLSSEPRTDAGRHPLPSPAELKERFGRMGITTNTQVIVYDNMNGVFASRLWWMLHYMGHASVAVLDGGWQAWESGGYPTESGINENTPAIFEGEPRTEMLVTIDDVLDQPLLIDSRSADRYRGEAEEARDPKSGHIPGATNHYFAQNWDDKRQLLPNDTLKANFHKLLGETPAAEATFYCGSGVSACYNLLAMHHAGLPISKLYVGSWSEWSRDENRPIATGEG